MTLLPKKRSKTKTPYMPSQHHPKPLFVLSIPPSLFWFDPFPRLPHQRKMLMLVFLNAICNLVCRTRSFTPRKLMPPTGRHSHREFCTYPVHRKLPPPSRACFPRGSRIRAACTHPVAGVPGGDVTQSQKRALGMAFRLTARSMLRGRPRCRPAIMTQMTASFPTGWAPGPRWPVGGPLNPDHVAT